MLKASLNKTTFISTWFIRQVVNWLTGKRYQAKSTNTKDQSIQQETDEKSSIAKVKSTGRNNVQSEERKYGEWRK